MKNIENKEETVVEFTKAELNEYMQRKVREIVGRKISAANRRGR